MSVQWISSFGQDNVGPENGWYNVDQIVCIGVNPYGSGQFSVDLFVNDAAVFGTEQHIYVFDTEAAAVAKTQELIAATGSVAA